MANEIGWRHTTTGGVVYYTIRNAAHQYWCGGDMGEFVTLEVADWAYCAIAMAESPASSYLFRGDWPEALTTVGWYWVDVFEQAGGSAAIADTLVGTLLLYWDGTTAKPWAADMTQCGGSAVGALSTGGGLPTVQDVAKILRRRSGDVYFVETAGLGGDDDNDGLSPSAPKLSPKTIIEAATAGDGVILGCGVFALGNNVIHEPADVAILGQGIDATKITSTALIDETHGCIVNPGTRSIVSDLTIEGVAESGYQAPLGCDQYYGIDNLFTDAVVENVRLVGDTDGVYFRGNMGACSLTMIASVVETQFDGITILEADVVIDCFDCTINAIGPTGSGAATSRGINVQVHDSMVRLYGGAVTARDGGTTTVGCYAKYGGRIEMHGGTIITECATGVVYDAAVSGSPIATPSRVVLDGTAHDHAKLQIDPVDEDVTLGEITVVSEAAAAIVANNLDDVADDEGKVVPTAAAITSIQSGLATAANQTTMDGKLDSILEDTGTTIPAAVATAQADLDIITGSDGVTLATAQAHYAPSKVGDAMTLTSGERTTLATAIWASTTRTLSSFGTLAASIWASATRTLTGSSGTTGPTAMTEATDTYVSAHKGGTKRLCCRVRANNGDDITQAGITSIAYTIYRIDATDPDDDAKWTAITGHTAVSVTVASVIHDTLQTDAYASDYNFDHTPVITTSDAFEHVGKYLVEYTIVPTTGQKILARFRVNVT